MRMNTKTTAIASHLKHLNDSQNLSQSTLLGVEAYSYGTLGK
jgi:hypothetical protein